VQLCVRRSHHHHRSPIKQVVDYAIQIAEALQEAHSKGIIHRDIKAENIMVNSKDQIKVMDFGLAKLKGSLKLTRTSSTIGTLAYMSPEQIKG
jgi:serine/threonine protein kinase